MSKKITEKNKKSSSEKKVNSEKNIPNNKSEKAINEFILPEQESQKDSNLDLIQSIHNHDLIIINSDKDINTSYDFYRKGSDMQFLKFHTENNQSLINVVEDKINNNIRTEKSLITMDNNNLIQDNYSNLNTKNIVKAILDNKEIEYKRINTRNEENKPKKIECENIRQAQSASNKQLPVIKIYTENLQSNTLEESKTMRFISEQTERFAQSDRSLL